MQLKRISIRNRIYLSFFLLGALFTINGAITIAIINYTNKIDNRITEVVDPSLVLMDEFKKMMIESKMYVTNWVFLRSGQEDKDALVELQAIDYPALKLKLENHTDDWKNKNWVDSLDMVFNGFEGVINEEKQIMASLQGFDDYDDPINKLGAEEQLEEMIIPRTASLLRAIDRVITFGENIKARENKEAVYYATVLRWVILSLVVVIIALVTLLSFYLSGRIVDPINKISLMVNDMGKGITRHVNHDTHRDEMGVMVQAVNHLSDALQDTATFAREVGNRNFNYPFEPLGEQDTLGKALIVMRDNLRESDERIREAQSLAKVGNWNFDAIKNRVTWSEEMKSIYGLSSQNEVNLLT